MRKWQSSGALPAWRGSRQASSLESAAPPARWLARTRKPSTSSQRAWRLGEGCDGGELRSLAQESEVRSQGLAICDLRSSITDGHSPISFQQTPITNQHSKIGNRKLKLRTVSHISVTLYLPAANRTLGRGPRPKPLRLARPSGTKTPEWGTYAYSTPHPRPRRSRRLGIPWPFLLLHDGWNWLAAPRRPRP